MDQLADIVSLMLRSPLFEGAAQQLREKRHPLEVESVVRAGRMFEARLQQLHRALTTRKRRGCDLAGFEESCRVLKRSKRE